MISNLSEMKVVFESGAAQAPVVSVIVMFRNEATTIPVALDSLLIQSVNFEWELIFVDGASSDRSVDVVRSHEVVKMVPSRIVEMPVHNSGMTVAQNVGALMARGKYLLFMQSDVKTDDKLAVSKIVGAFDEPGVVGTSFTCLGPDKELFDYSFWGQVFMSRYYRSSNPNHFDLKFNAVRVDVFMELGGFDDEHLALGGNDFEFQMRLEKKGRIKEVDVKAMHLHGWGKDYNPWGMLKKYCRNSEVTGVTTPNYFANRDKVPGYYKDMAQKLAVIAACVFSLVPQFWPWGLIPVLLAGIAWNKSAFVHLRSWRLVQVALFSVAVMYVFTIFFLKGLFSGKTLYDFDNKMK